MKKASSSPPKETKKKKLKTACLDEHGFKSIEISNGKTHDRTLDTGKPVEKVFCVGCNKSFKNEQGRCSHERECILAKLKHDEKAKVEKLSNHATEEIYPIPMSTIHTPRKQSRTAE